MDQSGKAVPSVAAFGCTIPNFDDTYHIATMDPSPRQTWLDRARSEFDCRLNETLKQEKYDADMRDYDASFKLFQQWTLCKPFWDAGLRLTDNPFGCNEALHQAGEPDAPPPVPEKPIGSSCGMGGLPGFSQEPWSVSPDGS
ncbi:hypothetical protein ABW21_db0209175 [Orbilia brochopaga]|nr:hypothetical protein ABW21_db0209175 [Drechslerella brochopaga]